MNEETDKLDDELSNAFREQFDDDPEYTENKTEPLVKPKKKKTAKKTTSNKQNVVDEFLKRQSSTISDRMLVNKFCIEQNKKTLLPSDWNVCYKYQVSGNIKDLLEYIHQNIRSRT